MEYTLLEYSLFKVKVEKCNENQKLVQIHAAPAETDVKYGSLRRRNKVIEETRLPSRTSIVKHGNNVSNPHDEEGFAHKIHQELQILKTDVTRKNKINEEELATTHFVEPRAAMKAAKTLMILMFSIMLVVFVGAEIEGRQVAMTGETLWIYESNQVCGASANTSFINQDFTTYTNSKQAIDKGATIHHCGECGQCSTDHDISILERTADTLTTDTTNCAKKGLLFGRGAAEKCMKEEIGFSSNCNDCWVDNIMCDVRKCVFTCIKSVFLYREANNEDGTEALNPCLECDERMCGPEFIKCSGANRRRLGVVSDIRRRDDVELCTRTK